MAPLKILKSQATDTAFMILSIPCLLSCLSTKGATLDPQVQRTQILILLGMYLSVICLSFWLCFRVYPFFLLLVAFLRSVVLAFAFSFSVAVVLRVHIIPDPEPPQSAP